MSRTSLARRIPSAGFCASSLSTVGAQFTTILLLVALGTPALFIARSPSVKAANLEHFPIPITAPPEPFLVHSQPYGSELFASVLSLTSKAAEIVRGPQAPAGLGNAKMPTRFESAYRAISSVFAFAKPTTNSAAIAPPPPQPSSVVDFDFDNDGKADIGRWHSSNAEFKVKNSNGGSESIFTVGSSPSAATIAPGDFNGDGKTDAAVFSSGTWTYKTSTEASAQTIAWGTSGDIPVAGDYDGDGTTDAAIFRPSTNTWWIQKSTGGYTSTSFGSSGDIPTPGDYDGDGENDLALYRPSTGDWHIRYLNDTDFLRDYRTSRRQTVETSISKLQIATNKAAETLVRNLHCENPAVEVRTAQIILDNAIKGAELIDVIERLEKLEYEHQKQNTKA